MYNQESTLKNGMHKRLCDFEIKRITKSQIDDQTVRLSTKKELAEL